MGFFKTNIEIIFLHQSKVCHEKLKNMKAKAESMQK
jgi:hypothetical protein